MENLYSLTMDSGNVTDVLEVCDATYLDRPDVARLARVEIVKQRMATLRAARAILSPKSPDYAYKLVSEYPEDALHLAPWIKHSLADEAQPAYMIANQIASSCGMVMGARRGLIKGSDSLVSDWQADFDDVEFFKSSQLRTMRPGLNIEECLAQERNFAAEVIKSYNRWSTEPNTVVLWDLDDTIGKYVKSSHESRSQWKYRLCFFRLFHFLRAHFPQVINGIQSSREKSALDTSMTHEQELLALAPFIHPQAIYAIGTTGKFVDDNEARAFHARFPSFNYLDAIAGKLLNTMRLEQHCSPKVIDDSRNAEIDKDNSLCVKSYIPQDESCFTVEELRSLNLI